MLGKLLVDVKLHRAKNDRFKEMVEAFSLGCSLSLRFMLTKCTTLQMAENRKNAESTGRKDLLVAETNHLVMGRKGRVLYLMLLIFCEVFQTTIQNATRPIIWAVLLPQRVIICMYKLRIFQM